MLLKNAKNVLLKNLVLKNAKKCVHSYVKILCLKILPGQLTLMREASILTNFFENTVIVKFRDGRRAYLGKLLKFIFKLTQKIHFLLSNGVVSKLNCLIGKINNIFCENNNVKLVQNIINYFSNELSQRAKRGHEWPS